MVHRTSNLCIHACVLAAGSSSRFGDSKLVQEYRGRPLIQHALIAARDACPGAVTLVVGHDQKNIISAASEYSDNILVNEQHLDGIGSSISAATLNCKDGADGILILLADQPLITADHLRNIMHTWSDNSDAIVATSFDTTRCPPILFPRNAFESLGNLSGDHGARGLLSSGEFSVASIDFPLAKYDIDTPENLRQLDQG